MHADQWNSRVESCLAQVQLQHRPAFEELYRLTNGKLFALILKIVPDRELAADLLQESYLKIWRNADSYRWLEGKQPVAKIGHTIFLYQW